MYNPKKCSKCTQVVTNKSIKRRWYFHMEYGDNFTKKLWRFIAKNNKLRQFSTLLIAKENP